MPAAAPARFVRSLFLSQAITAPSRAIGPGLLMTSKAALFQLRQKISRKYIFCKLIYLIFSLKKLRIF